MCTMLTNRIQITKKLSAYDEDATLSIDLLKRLDTCNGRIGATGMCLGGHLAYRCALDPRISAAVCYFATDIHSHSLGAGKDDDSLKRAGDIKGELVMIFGKLDNHVRRFLAFSLSRPSVLRPRYPPQSADEK